MFVVIENLVFQCRASILQVFDAAIGPRRDSELQSQVETAERFRGSDVAKPFSARADRNDTGLVTISELFY